MSAELFHAGPFAVYPAIASSLICTSTQKRVRIKIKAAKTADQCLGTAKLQDKVPARAVLLNSFAKVGGTSSQPKREMQALGSALWGTTKWQDKAPAKAVLRNFDAEVGDAISYIAKKGGQLLAPLRRRSFSCLLPGRKAAQWRATGKMLHWSPSLKKSRPGSRRPQFLQRQLNPMLLRTGW